MPETLWDKGPVLYHAPGVFPMGTDSILLADFSSSCRAGNVIDLGTGSGILAILSASTRPSALVTAIELSPAACALARKNFVANSLSERVTLLQGDIRDHRILIPAGRADLVLSNPPYFQSGSGPDAIAGLSQARGDSSCNIEELCQAAGWATRWGGAFCLLWRPERLCDLFCALRASGLEPKRLRTVRHDRKHEISLLLIEARRGGRSGLKWEPELLLYEADGTESPELLRIYHRSQHTAAQPQAGSDFLSSQNPERC